MRTQLPPLLPEQSKELAIKLRELLTGIYTDIFFLYDKTSVSDPTAMGNADNEIGSLTFSATPTQAECNALRDKCEELADDVRNIHTTLTSLIDSLQARELV